MRTRDDVSATSARSMPSAAPARIAFHTNLPTDIMEVPPIQGFRQDPMKNAAGKVYRGRFTCYDVRGPAGERTR